jgi:FtsZ-interacting cell division protein ZipA
MPVILIVLLIAVAALLFVARWQSRSRLLAARKSKSLNGESLRPLFGLDDDDLRSQAREAEQIREAEAAVEARRTHAKKLESFYEFRQTWLESPNRMNTIELLRRASEMESGAIFKETVDAILHNRNDAFSDHEIADLIESHFAILPLNEKTPGTAFMIKQELAALRPGPETKSDRKSGD